LTKARRKTSEKYFSALGILSCANLLIPSPKRGKEECATVREAFFIEIK
jgi:hypothetical protein